MTVLDVQHATITTTVHTSIRMPPSQPPPRINPSAGSEEDLETAPHASSPTTANVSSGSYHVNSNGVEQSLPSHLNNGGTGDMGLESDNDDELLASVTPKEGDAELHGDTVRTASIVNN